MIIRIPFDEAVALDKVGRLADVFKEKIKNVYEMFGVPKEIWM